MKDIIKVIVLLSPSEFSEYQGELLKLLETSLCYILVENGISRQDSCRRLHRLICYIINLSSDNQRRHPSVLTYSGYCNSERRTFHDLRTMTSNRKTSEVVKLNNTKAAVEILKLLYSYYFRDVYNRGYFLDELARLRRLSYYSELNLKQLACDYREIEIQPDLYKF